MSNRGKYRAKSSKINLLLVPVFTPLSNYEQSVRAELEIKVKTAFYSAGMALIQLKQERLYRNTHLSFEEFCLDVFSFSSDYAYLKMAAAKIYENLMVRLPSFEGKPTNGRDLPLPTRQRQLRPIVKAKLDGNAQVEVWAMAISLAEGKVPTSQIVLRAVQLYLAKDNLTNNPFIIGEICRILSRGNSQLKGMAQCWCIVDQVHSSSCTVNTWSNEIEVPIENLESLKFNPEQDQSIENIGIRMTRLHETGSLDDAAVWVLSGLAKLDRPYLTTLEEKLLQVIEEEYGLID
jgi:hypothetical protein